MYKYLIKVEPVTNNNKFYEMISTGSTFTVTYGRVGARGVKKTYPLSSWDSKYHEKMAKGYKDVTDIHNVSVTSDDGYSPIPDKEVREFVETLQSYVSAYLKRNYTIKSSEVTPQMVEEAQNLVNSLYSMTDKDEFNEVLKKIFVILPRVMGDVSSYLALSDDDFTRIIEREESTLSVMKGRVDSTASVTGGKGDYLEAHGLEMRPATADEVKTVKRHMDSSISSRINRVVYVKNKSTDEAFYRYLESAKNKRVKFLCHGTRNPNVLSIADVGLKIHPPIKVQKAGHMWGYGEYFGNNNAEGSKKAFGYTSLDGYWNRRLGGSVEKKGYLLIFKVATGHAMQVSQWGRGMSELDYDKIHRWGYDSLHVHGGVSVLHDELIVYREDQMTLRYIVELN